MQKKYYLLLVFVLSLSLWSCQSAEKIEKKQIAELEHKIESMIHRSPYIAHLEAVYQISFANYKENFFESDDYYIRIDKANVSYGYPLDKILIKISKSDNQKILHVRLPNPKRISIDRSIMSQELTHVDYKPIDKEKNYINVDKEIQDKFDKILEKYESKHFEMTRNVSREYFETLAHRFGLKLNLEFIES